MKQTPKPVGYVNYGHAITIDWIIDRLPATGGKPLSSRTLQYWIAKLRAEGYIETERKSNGLRIRICNAKKWSEQLQIPFDKPVPVQPVELRKTGTSDTQGLADQIDTPMSITPNVSIYVKENIKEKEQARELTLARLPRVAEIVEAGDLFEVFYQAYPRKIQRQLAHSSWIALRLDEHLGEILASIAAWKQSGVWDEERYIPYPKTFLRSGIWKEHAPTEEKSNAERKAEKRLADNLSAVQQALGRRARGMDSNIRRTLPR